MTSLNHLSIMQAIEGLKRGDFSATELVRSHIENIERFSELNAYVTTTFELALSHAKAAEANYLKKRNKPLEGIPIGVKDLYCTRGILTTCSSKILHNFVPQYESTVTQRVFDSGAIMLGKTNMDEFAMGSTTTNSFFGATINPWKAEGSVEQLVAGGSSGGSSAAVSAFLAMAALGSDTGGSVRQPASYTGLFAIKPSYGRCSRRGMIAFASSLDQAGVLTRNAIDGAIMLESMMGFDPLDSTSLDASVPKLTDACAVRDLSGVKIAIPIDLMSNPGMIPEVLDMWKRSIKDLESLGAEIIEVKMPMAHHALAVYYIIAPAEASSNLARYDGVRYGLRQEDEGDGLNDMYIKTRSDGFGAEVKRRIMIGTYVLSSKAMDSYYIRAQKVRRLIALEFRDIFQKADAVLLPSAPTDAFALNAKLDPVSVYLNDIFTIPASLAGLPCASVPAGLSKRGLPLGMQVVCKHLDELNVFRVSSALEKVNEHLNFKPRGF
ncbi:Aspartyl/glutamyl-tRNA(Asn/Gln) amidotransferase subunit A [Rickettsiales endosymbiont of Paramecium tredecaurelia]|uniref:Asp-tRNA(Asn)/Glu-tRNA(Gln) amidotransferase subunit GatA n=1 Tax=Candidatus Sarmatiella mevalonica TaxID=2770581 RepID=UPI0019233CB8|nr:Asp-tRNA(Asn)/Glu-tRNA(Gln) amidotransferase subunit GatA [Candidatus Sarmatiella mevalonica]MBL3284892.1 Aspartyl/glutamyl-tRNA(Asn/Gln) amidotransferase subunit A [Candidatus Sarmatiella mevalonica]